MNRDPYEVLGVPRTASADEIKSAYRRLARKFHPDVNPNDPTSEEKFKEIGAAYAVLGDAEKKARFDQFGTTEDMPQDPFQGGGGFQDLFDMFFGGMGGQQQGRRSAIDGDDAEVETRLSLKEVLSGVKRTITFRRREACDACSGTGSEGGKQPDPCPTCRGAGVVSAVRQTFLGSIRTQSPCPNCRGVGYVITDPCKKCRGKRLVAVEAETEVNIPAGVESGARIHLPGQGDHGLGGGRPGDLYIELQVDVPTRFEREGQRLVCEVDITYAQAAIGDTIDVEGIEEVHEVEVPPGTQPGEALILRGLGLPPLYGGKRGDLITVINVQVPRKLSDKQADALRQYAELSGEPVPKGPEKGGGLLGNIFGKKK